MSGMSSPRAGHHHLDPTHPQSPAGVLRGLRGLVCRLTERTGDLVFLDLAGRVAEALVQLTRSHAQDDRQTLLDVGLSQSDIAAMVGASRPVVDRILQLLASRGLLSMDGRVLVLCDPRHCAAAPARDGQPERGGRRPPARVFVPVREAGSGRFVRRAQTRDRRVRADVFGYPAGSCLHVRVPLDAAGCAVPPEGRCT